MYLSTLEKRIKNINILDIDMYQFIKQQECVTQEKDKTKESNKYIKCHDEGKSQKYIANLDTNNFLQ